MKQIYYLGVDISKEKIDVAVIDQHYKLLMEKVIKNEDSCLIRFLGKVLEKLKVEKENLLVCCEETGIYKRPLQRACTELAVPLWVEVAIKIKRAASSLRGKSDKLDALRIAEYAARYADKKILFKEPSVNNKNLQTLLNSRETILDTITRTEQQMNESKRFDKEKYEIQRLYFKPVLVALKRQLQNINNQIDATVSGCSVMTRTAELLTSIPGIGKQTALQFIVYTQNFKLFKNAKHLACYAGVAPFPNESGKSVKKARVSNLANKKLKKLLHFAAMACTRTKGELKEYYIRKVTEGKNKMLVLNNIRNKIVKRMFAIMKRGTEYFSINLENKLAF